MFVHVRVESSTFYLNTTGGCVKLLKRSAAPWGKRVRRSPLSTLTHLVKKTGVVLARVSADHSHCSVEATLVIILSGDSQL